MDLSTSEWADLKIMYRAEISRCYTKLQQLRLTLKERSDRIEKFTRDLEHEKAVKEKSMREIELLENDIVDLTDKLNDYYF